MPFERDSASDHLDLYDRLLAFLTTDAGWTILDEDSSGSVIFDAEGMSGTEHIYSGVSVHSSPSDDAYALGFWMFRDYNAALGHLQQPGHSGVRYLPIYNTVTPYSFVANAQRLMVQAKISTVYPSAHMGKFLPQGTPGEYPQPYYLAAPVPSPTDRWSTISESHRGFFDPGLGGALISLPSGLWRNVANFYESSGEQIVDGTNYVWPFASAVGSTAALVRYRELRERIDGGYWLLPLILHGEDPEEDTWGEIDGAFAVSGFNNASDNTVTIDGVQYLVIQNMHRTGRMYYAAIKLE